MRIVDSDPAAEPMGANAPNYDDGNPILRLMGCYEELRFAAEREHYQQDLIQTLLPFEWVRLYGPAPPNGETLDPRAQDFVDFQKQNVRDFALGDMRIMRGWATLPGEWSGPMLRISYRGGPDSRLSKAANHQLGDSVRLFLKVGARTPGMLLTVPYNEDSDWYELELWGYANGDLSDRLDERGRAAMARGELLAAPELIAGASEDFRREAVEDRLMPQVSPDHPMHPINPLRIELAWCDATESHWDSRGGANYVYEFSMLVRGWENFLKVGVSKNPHGGVGRLEYRNLMSNYFDFRGSVELGRTPEPWSFDAFGSKDHHGRREPFLSVDYMDIHVVRPNAAIGLHRHRDNQELFLVLENEAVMIVGDWAELPHRQRAFEIRTLRAGHFALLKPGQLHGLVNPTDENIPLFMFGGYD